MMSSGATMGNNSEPVKEVEEEKDKVEEEEEEEKLLVPSSPPSPREEWTNPIDFFVSTLGVAVGLGNIWRFPKLCYENGGGSFLIPYLLMLLICGLPLFFLELTLGQYSGSGPLKVFRRMTPVAGGLGLSLVIVGGFFAFYFIVVTSWSIWYLAASLDPSGLPWVRCSKDFNTATCWSTIDEEDCNKFKSTANGSNNYDNNNSNTAFDNFASSFNNSDRTAQQSLFFNASCWSPTDLCKHLSIGSWQPELGRCSAGAIQRTSPTVEYFERHVLGNQENSWQDYGGLRWQSVVCLAAAWILVALALVRGTKSQGKAAYFTTFVPYILILILSIRGFSLEGASLGLSFLFTPQWEKLLDMDVWKAAALQIIFSLGSCSGCNLSLASYNRFNHNCMRDAVLIAICNCVTSIFCACVVFSILGYMAHSTSRPVDQVVQGGEGLVFVVYPEVVSLLPEVAGLGPYTSQVFSVIFFMMLILVALGSTFGDFSTVTTAIFDHRPDWSKKKPIVVILTAAIMFTFGLIFCFNGGVYMFRLFDSSVPSWNQLLLGLLEVVLISYVYKIDLFMEVFKEMGIKMHSSVRSFWKVCWLYITPLVFVTLLIDELYSLGEKEYEEGPMAGKKLPKPVQLLGFLLTGATVVSLPVVALQQLSKSVPSLIRPSAKFRRPESCSPSSANILVTSQSAPTFLLSLPSPTPSRNSSYLST